MSIEKDLLKEYEPLFKKAKKENLWFVYHNDQWLSPSELKKEHAKGRYLWGIDNWHLKNPQEKIQNLEKVIKSVRKEIDQIKERIRVENL